MRIRFLISYFILAILFSAIWYLTDSTTEQEEFKEKAKIALREVGNDLLLEHGDSSSRVLPIQAINPTVYSITFEQVLAFDPAKLDTSIKVRLKHHGLPLNYRTTVIQCEDQEVAHSFEIEESNKNVIVACGGRDLPIACYEIKVKFLKDTNPYLQLRIFLYVLLFGAFGLLMLRFNKQKRLEDFRKEKGALAFASFHFYPTENKLIQQAREIQLSKKECELLAIFVARPNEIIRREELTKRVWEDNGVIVGRSLDTYVSKLRKILQQDHRVQLINVHGVGYKLEINSKS